MGQTLELILDLVTFVILSIKCKDTGISSKKGSALLVQQAAYAALAALCITVIQPRLQPKPDLTDFGLQSYIHT